MRSGYESTPKRGVEAELLGALAAVYREVDDAFAGWSCPASTECCRFGVTGREPYVTSLELASIRNAVAAAGRRPATSPRRGRRLALHGERPCPLLTDNGRCSIYAARPLGCRTFFCERAEAASVVRHAEVVGFVRRVQALAARHEPGGDQGRPLTRAL